MVTFYLILFEGELIDKCNLFRDLVRRSIKDGIFSPTPDHRDRAARFLAVHTKEQVIVTERMKLLLEEYTVGLMIYVNNLCHIHH